MKKKINIALTWGATGWHIFPLLSIYNYLNEDKNYSFLWVWEEDSLEEKIALKNKIKFLWISAWKIRRYFDYRNFYEPFKNLTWIVFGIYYILKYKIDIVFSKWGYVSLPLCIAAFILRKKIFVHESDTISWISNSLIFKIASKIFYTFPNEKIDNKKFFLSWQILNPELLDYITDIVIRENESLEIIVLWWSQWSKTIFESLLKILPDLEDINFQIILWEKNMDFKQKFNHFPNVIVHDFITQKSLGRILKNTDIAITRWWSTTLWELNVFWIHSIIIPLSNSAWNHQQNNALYFKKEFWSDILNENNNIEIELFRILQKYKDLRKSWLNLENLLKPLQIIKEELEK